MDKERMGTVMRPEELIAQTKKGFEESFRAEAFYRKQTRDQAHLERILGCLNISDGMRILDLGTGTGYLAFAIAGKYPGIQVTGLDIVKKAMERNRKQAETNGARNLQFVNYDGLDFPFAANAFDIVMTRYALHHFPKIYETFQEISRVLKPGGTLFIADPAPNDDDTQRFVDAYMQMKQDGHIRFYTRQEWLAIAQSSGFCFIDGFETRIRFPRKKKDALALDTLLSRFPPQVAQGYTLEIMEDEVWITEKVNNLLFQKELPEV